MTVATTIKTGTVIYQGGEYWVLNSCVNRQSMLYVVLKQTAPPLCAEESARRLAEIKDRGWKIWWQAWCVVSTPEGKVEWKSRGRDDEIPTVAEIEARLQGEPDTGVFAARMPPEFCVGGEWVPESECTWVSKQGGRKISV